MVFGFLVLFFFNPGVFHNMTGDSFHLCYTFVCVRYRIFLSVCVIYAYIKGM